MDEILKCDHWYQRLSLWMKSCVTIQMKATEQYFPVVLFIVLYKVLLNLEFVDEKCSRTLPSRRVFSKFHRQN